VGLDIGADHLGICNSVLGVQVETFVSYLPGLGLATRK
jgi:hypothetical protein